MIIEKEHVSESKHSRFCSLCSSIIRIFTNCDVIPEGRGKFRSHYTGMAALVAAAELDCYICTRVLREVRWWWKERGLDKNSMDQDLENLRFRTLREGQMIQLRFSTTISGEPVGAGSFSIIDVNSKSSRCSIRKLLNLTTPLWQQNMLKCVLRKACPAALDHTRRPSWQGRGWRRVEHHTQTAHRPATL